jgi:hypothetical protein
MRNSDDLTPSHFGELYQLSLFSYTQNEFTAMIQVSTDDMNSWRRNGWLSFDPSVTTKYSQKEGVEVLFIKGLAHSGLSDAMINRVLSAGLQCPYCYDPSTTFFSFVQNRWITLPPEHDPADVTTEYIDELAADEDWEALRQLRNRVTAILEDAEASE